MSNTRRGGRYLAMQITIEAGAVLVRWPSLGLTMFVDPERAWWVLHGHILHAAHVAQC